MDMQYIEKINNLFARSRKCYSEYFFDRSDENKQKCDDIINGQLSIFSAFDKVHNWFQKELEDGYFNQESNYINRCEGTFKTQFKFLSSFTKAMEIYVEDSELTAEYLKRYGLLDKRELLGEELLLALQIRYLIAFSALESIVNEFAYSYKRLVPSKDLNYSYEKNISYINLDYGVNNSKALDIIFEGLNGTYIDSTLEDFKLHFESRSIANRKIKFIGSNANLINLFFGVNQMEIGGVKILNASKINTIIEHFEDRDGTSYNYKSLEAQSQKLTKKPRDFKKMQTLLMKLNGLG